ncbi:MAG: hypothetical protein FJZ63_05075, partial [Chlamydiae bacterium]|nr:hypothetical protein [Chlamydiota bacterium]
MGANLKLKEDLLDGLKRSWEHSGDLRSTSFWQVCLEKGLTEKNETECSEMLSTYARRTWDFQHAFKEFHEFLQEIPFAVALRHWVDVIIQDGVLGERYVRCMKRLLMQDALPLKQRDHAPVTLAYLRASGHQEIIENIRCQRVWTHTEKEEIVQCYVRFSYDLAKYTLNYVPEGYDPDRKLTHTRLISYEVFHSFIE